MKFLLKILFLIALSAGLGAAVNAIRGDGESIGWTSSPKPTNPETNEEKGPDAKENPNKPDDANPDNPETPEPGDPDLTQATQGLLDDPATTVSNSKNPADAASTKPGPGASDILPNKGHSKGFTPDSYDNKQPKADRPKTKDTDQSQGNDDVPVADKPKPEETSKNAPRSKAERKAAEKNAPSHDELPSDKPKPAPEEAPQPDVETDVVEPVDDSVAKAEAAEANKVTKLLAEYRIRSIDFKQMQAAVKAGGSVVVDARSKFEFDQEGHIPGAISLPDDKKEEKLGDNAVADQVMSGLPIIVYCSSKTCDAATLTAKFLKDLDMDVSVYVGGFKDWKNQKGKISK